MGGLTFHLALPVHRLFLYHRYARPIHLHIEDGDRFAHDHRQIQLHGPMHLLSLARGDILPNRLRRSLHGFGGHIQIGELFHLLASVVEGRLLADHCLHPAHSRRGLRVFDIQFDIGGKLALVTVRA
jgi:hypothetical protein